MCLGSWFSDLSYNVFLDPRLLDGGVDSISSVTHQVLLEEEIARNDVGIGAITSQTRVATPKPRR